MSKVSVTMILGSSGLRFINCTLGFVLAKLAHVFMYLLLTMMATVLFIMNVLQMSTC